MNFVYVDTARVVPELVVLFFGLHFFSAEIIELFEKKNLCTVNEQGEHLQY